MIREFLFQLFGAFHPAARGHVADHFRHLPLGCCRLPVLARCATPASRFSHHLRRRQPARRKPGDHGFRCRHSPRAPVRPHCWRHPDDFFQRPRFHQHHSSVRSQSRYQRRRSRRPGLHQRRSQPASRRSSRPAHLSQGQSRGCSHLVAGPDLRKYSPCGDLRRGRFHPRAEARAGRWRRPGIYVGQRPPCRTRRSKP